jgi:rubrerythrin
LYQKIRKERNIPMLREQAADHRRANAAAPHARFVRLLQLAYSAELGAALAYGGHAASVSEPAERLRIAEIRREELDHRARLGRMLQQLDSAPDPGLEWRYRCIGRGIAAFCRVGGWFLPMYGAGWLERNNIGDYERAARLGVLSGEDGFADELLFLAEAEWEHERYFRLKAATHRFARLLKVWRAPAPKTDIRRSFARFIGELRATASSPQPRFRSLPREA